MVRKAQSGARIFFFGNASCLFGSDELMSFFILTHPNRRTNKITIKKLELENFV